MTTSTSIDLQIAAPIVVALNAIGFSVKRIPFLPNWIIPFILMAAGAAGYAGISGWTWQNAIIGIGLGWTAVGGHQTVRAITDSQNETPPDSSKPGSDPV